MKRLNPMARRGNPPLEAFPTGVTLALAGMLGLVSLFNHAQSKRTGNEIKAEPVSGVPACFDPPAVCKVERSASR